MSDKPFRITDKDTADDVKYHLMAENPPKILHVIPCSNLGVVCPYRLGKCFGGVEEAGPWEYWCSKWRENRMRDKVFCACQPEYKVQEPAIIDAEQHQKERFSLRSEK